MMMGQLVVRCFLAGRPICDTSSNLERLSPKAGVVRLKEDPRSDPTAGMRANSRVRVFSCLQSFLMALIDSASEKGET